MPAGITNRDSMFSVRETPWHGEGVVLPKPPKTIKAAVKAAGLDWTVIQRPVKVTVEGKTRALEGYFVNIREDTMEPLGIVTDRYTPVANQEAFSFLAAIFGSEMHFETAGSLMGGRRVWVLMTIPEFVEVGGDPIGQYAFISNSHDGKSSVLAAMTPVRIVCANTEGAAIRLAKGANAQRTYSLRHLGNMSQKIAEARNVLDVTVNYHQQFKEIGDKLALAPLSEKRALKALKSILPVDESQGERAARNREEAREAVLTIFRGQGPDGDTSGNSPGSVWCFYNACVEYADWSRPARKSRWQRAIHDPDSLKRTAWETSLDLAGQLA